MRKSPQHRVIKPLVPKPEADTCASPICYAQAPELRPEFLAEKDKPANTPIVWRRRVKPKTKSSQ